MAEVEIGIGKTARRAYRLDDVAIVPSRRTRDPEDVDISCNIDAYRFEVPVLAAPADSVTSPATAVELGRLGAAGVLHLEGLWTSLRVPRHAVRGDRRAARVRDPAPAGDLRRAGQGRANRPAHRRGQGVRGHLCGGVITPHRTLELADAVLRAEPSTCW